MIDADNEYTRMQRSQYDANVHLNVENHKPHDANPDYWNILMSPLVGRTCLLDFGCGHGRNVGNMHQLRPDAERVDGCDISIKTLEKAREYLDDIGLKDREKYHLYHTDGISLSSVPSGTYDFVMSTIVLQHICVWSIRFAILKDMFRVLQPGGMLSIQMGLGEGHPATAKYYEDKLDATGTNSLCDVQVLHPAEIMGDVRAQGFVDVWHAVRPSFIDRHANWIFVQAKKP